MIKKLLFVFSFMLVATSMYAQQNQTMYASAGSGLQLDVKPSYDLLKADFNSNKLNLMLDKAKERHPMEKTGRVLTFIGVPLAVLGAVMVSGADELYYNCTNGECEGDPAGGFGIIILGAGAGMAGTGIVLWTIGAKKSKE